MISSNQSSASDWMSENARRQRHEIIDLSADNQYRKRIDRRRSTSAAPLPCHDHDAGDRSQTPSPREVLEPEGRSISGHARGTMRRHPIGRTTVAPRQAILPRLIAAIQVDGGGSTAASPSAGAGLRRRWPGPALDLLEHRRKCNRTEDCTRHVVDFIKNQPQALPCRRRCRLSIKVVLAGRNTFKELDDIKQCRTTRVA